MNSIPYLRNSGTQKTYERGKRRRRRRRTRHVIPFRRDMGSHFARHRTLPIASFNYGILCVARARESSNLIFTRVYDAYIASYTSRVNNVALAANFETTVPFPPSPFACIRAVHTGTQDYVRNFCKHTPAENLT